MQSYSKSTLTLGILAAFSASTLLISAQAFAGGQKPDTDGCCEKGQCEPTAKTVPNAPDAAKTPVTVDPTLTPAK